MAVVVVVIHTHAHPLGREIGGDVLVALDLMRQSEIHSYFSGGGSEIQPLANSGEEMLREVEKTRNVKSLAPGRVGDRMLVDRWENHVPRRTGCEPGGDGDLWRRIGLDFR